MFVIGAITFQSTLPVKGATPQHYRQSPNSAISIHAPRKGSDFVNGQHEAADIISIHAPRKGSDHIIIYINLYLF